MTTADDLLGKPESQDLEFKRTAALDSPRDLAREAVAMLNAQGGEIWIGVEEAEERAVRPEGVPDTDRARRRLEDSLLDSIEPRLSSEDFELSVEQVGSVSLLRLMLRASAERQPYSAGGRFFLRVGGRVRPMTRVELQDAFSKGGSGSGSTRSETEENLTRERDEVAANHHEILREIQPDLSIDVPGLAWLALQPVDRLELELHGEFRRQLEELLEDPTALDLPRYGRHFVRRSSPLTSNQKALGWSIPWEFRAELRYDGGLRFFWPLDQLKKEPPPYSTKEHHFVFARWLLEYLASAFRLAGRLLDSRMRANSMLASDLALFDLDGWVLVGDHDALFGKYDEPDFLLEPRLFFPWEEVRTTPDRCAFRLVRQLFGAYKVREEQIPKAYDRGSGRLIFPT